MLPIPDEIRRRSYPAPGPSLRRPQQQQHQPRRPFAPSSPPPSPTTAPTKAKAKAPTGTATTLGATLPTLGTIPDLVAEDPADWRKRNTKREFGPQQFQGVAKRDGNRFRGTQWQPKHAMLQRNQQP